MWESIIGMLVGTGLMVGGFYNHDVNYRPSDGLSLVSVHSKGKTYAVSSTGYNSPERKKEFLGYTVGAVGAAVLALSVKHAWQSRHTPRISTDEMFRKFRQKINKKQIAGLALGLGMFIAGIEFQDADYKRDGIPYKDGRLDLNAIPSNASEHFGFFMGATGSAIFGLSLTHTW